ncbi:3'-5' exonuclease [Paraoerskovia sediminicola]|uniref:3'-5' exonuclease n=1 Tax=Paraoerskovia sediminicola TaxID=1138587 RepID=UPI0033061FBA
MTSHPDVRTEPPGEGAPAADDAGGPGAPTPVTIEGDVVDHRSIVDALDDLPAPGKPARDGRVLSAAAHARLTALAATLRELRSETYLSLPELVGQAERALGLDIEVEVAARLSARAGEVVGSGDRGRAHLDAFADVTAGFASHADTPTLGAFLAWLGAASAQERGLDLPLREPDPDAVQVVTIHAAKGLEWDVVAVTGMSAGVFPSCAVGADGPKDSGWLTGLGVLPFPLRGDSADLPRLPIREQADSKDLHDALGTFKLAAGEHEVAEERRLAYVAMTRARESLLLAGAWWRGGASPCRRPRSSSSSPRRASSTPPAGRAAPRTPSAPTVRFPPRPGPSRTRPRARTRCSVAPPREWRRRPPTAGRPIRIVRRNPRPSTI